MKKILLLFSFALSFGLALGQSNKEDVEIIQNLFGKEKKDLVQVYMTIPGDRSAEFWVLYDKYEADRKALGKERIKLIEDYANAHSTLDDKKANELMKRKAAFVTNYAKMQQKHYGSISKLIGGYQAAKFFQLEDYLENNIRLHIQESIPFIDELDKTKIKDATKQ